ncbi:MAG: ABC transporter permease, partial [Deltaproteobacteria bacterium]|nr:ABC transporter permease [Deltaproteobacteria bacterium]
MPWNTFANTIMRTSGILVEKRGLISKIPISLITLLLYVAISEGIVLAFIMVIFAVAANLSGMTFTANMLYMPVLICQQQLIAFCIGSGVAILTVFMRDLREVVGIVLQVWFWLTPIVYVVDILPQMVQNLQWLNPAFWFVDGFHRILIFNT